MWRMLPTECLFYDIIFRAAYEHPLLYLQNLLLMNIYIISYVVISEAIHK